MFSLCSDDCTEGKLLISLAKCRQQYFRCWAECVATVVLVKTLLFSLHLMSEFIFSVNCRWIYCSTSEVNSCDNTVPPSKIPCELAPEKLQCFGSLGEELSDIPCTCLRQ